MIRAACGKYARSKARRANGMKLGFVPRGALPCQARTPVILSVFPSSIPPLSPRSSPAPERNRASLRRSAIQRSSPASPSWCRAATVGEPGESAVQRRSTSEQPTAVPRLRKRCVVRIHLGRSLRSLPAARALEPHARDPRDERRLAARSRRTGPAPRSGNTIPGAPVIAWPSPTGPRLPAPGRTVWIGRACS